VISIAEHEDTHRRIGRYSSGMQCKIYIECTRQRKETGRLDTGILDSTARYIRYIYKDTQI